MLKSCYTVGESGKDFGADSDRPNERCSLFCGAVANIRKELLVVALELPSRVAA